MIHELDNGNEVRFLADGPLITNPEERYFFFTALATRIATLYIQQRVAEYAKLNQDELRFDDLMNNTTKWKDAILAIKAKYPKETT